MYLSILCKLFSFTNNTETQALLKATPIFVKYTFVAGPGPRIISHSTGNLILKQFCSSTVFYIKFCGSVLSTQEIGPFFNIRTYYAIFACS